MGYGKFGLKLLGTHVLMTVIELFLYLLLFGIFPKSELYQWFIGLFFIGLFWLVIYADASSYGQNNLKRGNFHKSKGFVSGAIASVPGLVLYIVAAAYQASGLNLKYLDLAEVALRLWLIPYVKLYVTFETQMPYIAVLFILMLPVVSGFSYLDGKRRREKDLKAIEAKEARRNQLSKRNS
jgi:hypothetical protein